MAEDSPHNSGVENLLDSPELADAIADDRFKLFLDQVPIAIAVSQLETAEKIIYLNIQFENLIGRPAAEIEGKSWDVIPGGERREDEGSRLSEAIRGGQDYLGSFTVGENDSEQAVDAWSNIIQDNSGVPVFRLMALVPAERREGDFEDRIREKEVLLRELQHRVKNNLQMITSLIRLEARNMPDGSVGERFDRLAGRVEALALLYRALEEAEDRESVDLGVYLSQIGSAVMRAHAVEGIHLDMQVDTWPVSVNVAMPLGLVVNELLTNALKHAFAGRDGGTITLHSLTDATGCTVTIADDGVGLPEGDQWPKRGKLGALIVQSLRQNAMAQVNVESKPGQGTRVTIFFARDDAAPAVAA